MNTDPKNKVVVVTGGAEGIGYAIAEQFLLNSAKCVIILDINEELGVEAVNSLNNKHGKDRANFIKCDVVKDLKTVTNEIYNKYEKVDVLVNNAGVPECNVDKVVDINLKAVINWSFEFWGRMRKDKIGSGGTIINISSLYGLTISEYFPVYHASKFGVIGFSKSLGHEVNFNRSGVRVVVLCPGFTSTTIIRKTGLLTFDDEGLQDSVKKYVLNLKLQSPDRVGEAAMEIFKKAHSGTVWKIVHDEPLVEVLQ